LLLCGNALPLWPVGGQSLGRMPVQFLQAGQEPLRRDVPGREEARVGDLARPSPIRLDGHAVLRQRLGGMLDGERLVSDPDRRALRPGPVPHRAARGETARSRARGGHLHSFPAGGKPPTQRVEQPGGRPMQRHAHLVRQEPVAGEAVVKSGIPVRQRRGSSCAARVYIVAWVATAGAATTRDVFPSLSCPICGP
jgi:hypothetical protein